MKDKKRKKSFRLWVGHEWIYNFKQVEHRAGGFKELQIPETREHELGFANTKVRITIEEI